MPLGSSIDGFSLIEGETNMGFEAKLKIAISQRDTAQYNYDTSVNTLEAAENEKKQAETDMSLAQERLRLSTVSVSDAELDVENLKMLLDEKIMRVKILEEESKSQ